jgi:ABC-type transport system involved in cytochrome c biogenesis ATPase subunit
MIAQVEALSYRCLHHVQQELSPFQILVGPNASGKSTFLDVILFLSDIVWEKEGVDRAVRSRAPDVRDLTWMRSGGAIEMAVEANIPNSLRRVKNGHPTYARVRYEVKVGARPPDGRLSLLAESLWLRPDREPTQEPERTLFPMHVIAPDAIIRSARKHAPAGWRNVVRKIAESGNDYFRSETSDWNNLFRLPPQRSALANLPEDEEKFPTAIWFRLLLLGGVQRLALDSRALSRPSGPGAPRVFLPDGSNLPWVVEDLLQRAPNRHRDWVSHLRTALPDLHDVRTVERPEDRHRYLVLEYTHGLKVPAWGVSDGTLRLLALTVLAYLPHPGGIYLIEEPENGIHPRAVETVMQSLSSVYDAQVLIATHSPVLLSLAKPEDVLCFARNEAGETDVVRGSEHPQLKEWKGEVDLGTLFAGGVLG